MLSVKIAEGRGKRGTDGGKRGHEHQRHIASATLRLLLSAAVTVINADDGRCRLRFVSWGALSVARTGLPI
jgi:hypothetical protein